MKNKYLLLILCFFSLQYCNEIPEIESPEWYVIYPNPCVDVVILQLRIGNGEEISIKLFGVKGNEIFETKLLANNDALQINVSEEEAGQLYFELEYDGKLYREKVIKIR